jgi:hypothetical protein
MSPRSTDEIHRGASSDVSADERTLYDPESDEEGYDGRPSGELLAGDHDILDSEDERDRLLTQKDGITGMFGKKAVRIGKLSQKAEKRERKKGQNEETSALMYEMEEGIGHSSTSLRSRRSSESDEQRLRASTSQRKVYQLSVYVEVVLILDLGTEDTPVASSRHIRFNRRTICCLTRNDIPPLDPQGRQRCSRHDVQRNFSVRAYDSPDLPRWIPRRLLISQSYADPKPIRTGRHFAQVHAPKLSQRDLSEPLHHGHWHVPGSPWCCGKHVLGSQT